MSVRSTIVALGALATSVVAHGTVKSFTTDGKENQGFLLDYYYAKQNGQSTPAIAAWSAENLDNGFVGPESYGTSDINCHKKAQPGALTAKVAAGGKVTFDWGQWPHGIGPVLTYVAECGGDCAKADKAALKWVKIDAAGHDGKTWAAQKLIDDGGKWTTNVPVNLKAGKYVFRHEIIALHAGGDKNGAQNYPQCFNVEVTGSGTQLPEGTLGTALYKADDKGILFNPYGPKIDYTIPGPALFGSSASGSGNSAPAPAPAPTSAPVPTSAPAATPTTPAAKPTSTAAPATGDDDECDAEDAEGEDDECDAEDAEGEDDECDAENDVDTAADEGDDCDAEDDTAADEDDECDAPEPSPTPAPAPAPAPTTLVTSTRPAATPAPGSGSGAGSAKLYAQCGGIGFSGPTSCSEGTCKVMNPYYSQCVRN